MPFYAVLSDMQAKERENGVKDRRLPLRNKRCRFFRSKTRAKQKVTGECATKLRENDESGSFISSQLNKVTKKLYTSATDENNP